MLLAFVHIHKAAGTTAHYILRSSYGAAHCDVQPWMAPPPHLEQWQVPLTADDLRRLQKIYPNLKSIASHSVHPYSDLEDVRPDIRYFTLMRDPIKMGASLYQYVIENQGASWSFEEWMAKETTHNRQTKIIAGKVDVDEAIRVLETKQIFVGLSERFDESMLMVKKQLAPDLNINYERKNVARNNQLAKKILNDEHTRQMLIEANQADIALYEYIRQEIYPKYQQVYGAQLSEDVAAYQTALSTFNQRQSRLSHLKLHMVYRPLRIMYRRGIRLV